MWRKELSQKQIFLHQNPVDFRRQIYGLVQYASGELKLDKLQESILIFQNKKKDKIKCLMWDQNGFVLIYKILEKGRFDFGLNQEGQIEIGYDELKMLISGMPIVHLGQDKSNTRFT